MNKKEPCWNAFVKEKKAGMNDLEIQTKLTSVKSEIGSGYMKFIGIDQDKRQFFIHIVDWANPKLAKIIRKSKKPIKQMWVRGKFVYSIPVAKYYNPKFVDIHAISLENKPVCLEKNHR